MSWNIVSHELRQNRRAFFTCLGVTVVFILLLLAKADAFVDNPEMERLLGSMPPGLVQAFGLDVESFRTLQGYLATQVFPYFIVILSSFAAAWAAGSIAKEKDRGTGEYLFTLPYRRSGIFWSKAAAHWIYMSLVYIAGSGVLLALLYSKASGELSWDQVLLLLWSGYLLVLCFMGIGYMLTSWFASDRTAVGIACGVAVLAFFLDMLSGSSEWMELIALLSPYQLVDATDIVSGGGLGAAGWLVPLGLYAAGLVVGVALLQRKDIP
ncbi:ABC transporter permease subunit [Paenibacillus sp. F411]|uniref:ABC-2 type transport system permease protein n=1 Tax=Paenibacillus algicola TaxID=2565926 RepID=A0A4P8XKW1_9BACL|nr:ABC transporter permease subunit [Paenibacillus algicola]MBO2943174.1 ABC transporter permease subunit [Paenibacillus sp. F411]QCT02270.1 hypothetical protein E6C60_1554 [Paenibacillus algicola]